jgi:hypothetical protein
MGIMIDTLKGMTKSYTVAFAIVLMALGIAEQFVPQLLSQYLTPQIAKYANIFFGVVVLILRVKTNKSLAEKV